jgi:hypothetical protein
MVTGGCDALTVYSYEQAIDPKLTKQMLGIQNFKKNKSKQIFKSFLQQNSLDKQSSKRSQEQ